MKNNIQAQLQIKHHIFLFVLKIGNKQRPEKFGMFPIPVCFYILVNSHLIFHKQIVLGEPQQELNCIIR